MGYGNYDVWQAEKDNGALKEYEGHGFRIVFVWVAYNAKIHGVIKYNDVILKILGDEWINL